MVGLREIGRFGWEALQLGSLSMRRRQPNMLHRRMNLRTMTTVMIIAMPIVGPPTRPPTVVTMGALPPIVRGIITRLPITAATALAPELGPRSTQCPTAPARPVRMHRGRLLHRMRRHRSIRRLSALKRRTAKSPTQRPSLRGRRGASSAGGAGLAAS
jgi:hypothetical protein